jgi:transposase-like protein
MAWITGSFLLDYRNRGCRPEVKRQIIDMSLNASGMRSTARALRISPTTMLSALKKQEAALETAQVHDIVIGLFVNRYAFRRAV